LDNWEIDADRNRNREIKSQDSRKKIGSKSLVKNLMTKHDEREAYASTTASPPPVQISLDDSIESEYKEAHFIGGAALMSPNTDFSDEV
jgi:hypothetical protein